MPTYVVRGRYRVGGMQEPGVFLMLFDKIRANEHGIGGPVPDVPKWTNCAQFVVTLEVAKNETRKREYVVEARGVM